MAFLHKPPNNREQLMRLGTLFVVLLLGLTAWTQTTTSRNWVDTEGSYTDAAGNALTVTNSLPKGGGTYTDTSGNTYSYVIFWHKVTNTSEVPLKLELGFPAEPYPIFSSLDSYIRLFLPPDRMTPENIGQQDYGLDLSRFLDAAFEAPSRLEKTIAPHGEFLFYVPILIRQARGTARAALVMDGDRAIYQIKIHPQDADIPCGKLLFKECY